MCPWFLSTRARSRLIVKKMRMYAVGEPLSVSTYEYQIALTFSLYILRDTLLNLNVFLFQFIRLS